MKLVQKLEIWPKEFIWNLLLFQTNTYELGFSFWSLICAWVDKWILFLGKKKSVRLQEWQKSEIMLVWHLSLTYSLNLNLGKCAREHFTILVCLLKQQTFFWKNQNLSYQKILHRPWIDDFVKDTRNVTLTYL